MHWTIALATFIVAILVLLLLKRIGQISPATARAYLANGALVIDVRSPGEFASGHLPIAVNIPLPEIESAVPRRVKDLDKVLLLHCQSGMRSGVACKKLKRLGYANTFNLGSYARASQLMGDN
ncbi:MAG TPA: rhodanese-like domain-containing protein [Acidobacteriaceae bacterium]